MGGSWSRTDKTTKQDQEHEYENEKSKATAQLDSFSLGFASTLLNLLQSVQCDRPASNSSVKLMRVKIREREHVATCRELNSIKLELLLTSSN